MELYHAECPAERNGGEENRKSYWDLKLLIYAVVTLLLDARLLQRSGEYSRDGVAVPGRDGL